MPSALLSLKYFYKNPPEYNIVCVDSLLGIDLHEGTSFPVGKTDLLTLYPLSFKEFLIALGYERLVNVIDDQKYDIFTSFKGALTEEYALMQLKSETGLNIYYYTNDKSTLEIDFVLDNGSRVVPLEIKGEENLKAKSLKTFIEKNDIKLAVRSSMADYKKKEVILNLSLYAISNIENEI